MNKMTKIGNLLFLILFLSSCPSSNPKFEMPNLYDNQGNPVIVEERTNGIHSMGTEYRGGVRVIYWNPNYWNSMAENENNRKFFILFHEICHYSMPTSDEGEASCCSIRIMETAKMLSDKEVATIISHKDAEEAIKILECYEQILNERKHKTN